MDIFFKKGKVMGEYNDRERFIPFRKAEIIDMLCDDGSLNDDGQKQFRSFCKILESLYHFEFHEKVEFLKNNYYPFNPDKDTKTIRCYSKEELSKCEKNLAAKFEEILNDANYEKMSDEELELAKAEDSIFFKIDLDVNMNDFDSYLLCKRGDAVRKATIGKFAKKFPFWKKVEVDVPVYERVALLLRFKGKEYFDKKGEKNPVFTPGSMIIKLFKDIPKADLEMLFPNAKARMKKKDKLMMGVPAVLFFIPTLIKTGAMLVLFVFVLWALIAGLFTGHGLKDGLTSQQMAGLVGGLSALGIILGYLYKQWNAYKNRKIQFMKMLGDSLYFKNLDNNAGVFNHIVDAAEEEECKEAILGYYFLLQNQGGLTQPKLDDAIEEWFEKKHSTLIDFEVDDALRKLKDLQLCTSQGEGETTVYQALSLDDGCRRLDEIWDNFFQYNNK